VRLHTGAGAMHVALGGSDRNRRDPRDLDIREAERVAQDDRRALFRRESGQRLRDVPPQVCECGQARRIAILVGRTILVDEGLRAADSLKVHAVAARVYHQPVQPRRELRLATELAQSRAELDERFLRSVPRLLQIFEELGGKPVDPGRVALDQRIECPGVAARRLAHELGIAQPLVRASGMPIPLVQTGLDFDRLHARLVYALVNPLDSLAPEVVEPLLTGSFGRPYLYEQACQSTQGLLNGQADEGAAAVCDVQTEGRGRLGRGWEAPPGTAILCSVLLKPPAGRPQAELSLVAGLAAAETVERALGLAVQLKWPNDVMVNRRKVAGVLAEASGEVVVLGIGLNVNQRREELPHAAQVMPASLYTSDGVRRERAPLLADLLSMLEHDYGLWLGGGLDALYDSLGARDFLRGRRVFLDGEAGTGIGIDRQGRLEVEVDGERRLVDSGEVLFER
jgi:BirA family transcriptional regulator, biotin operon repressor / biotin---[acetyl-CoA-carboxylase] ligase